MQLSRDELLSAYQTMKTIRVFEDRVNQEMGSGDIPGAVHLYAGQEASAVGICSLLDTIRVSPNMTGLEQTNLCILRSKFNTRYLNTR